MDIGGNEGCYSLFLRKYARSVMVFEPIPWMADELARKFGDSIVVSDLALSSSNGFAWLHIPLIDKEPATALASLSRTPSTSAVATREIMVKTARLDDAYEGDAGFIKIDVEGHEESVLEGAQLTIRRNRPRLLIEIEERHAPGALRRIVRFFKLQHYQCYFLDRGRLHPAAEFDPDRLQRPRDIGGTRAYINNFIFLPDEEADALLSRIARRPKRSGVRLRRQAPASDARQRHH